LLAVTQKKIVDTIFDSPKGCKRLLQFPSPSKDSHAPVKQPRKRKLLKEDALKAVASIYSYVAIFFILVAHHPE